MHADANHVLQQAPPTVHERSLIRLAWLAPDLQMAMLEGRQKPGLCLEDQRFAASRFAGMISAGC